MNAPHTLEEASALHEARDSYSASRPAQKPISSTASTKPWAITDGQLVIDHRQEEIESTIKNADFGSESDISFQGGLYVGGAFRGGKIVVDGTLIIGPGANFEASTVRCKRLYVNTGSLTCKTINTDTLVAWEGSLTAEETVTYKSLEQTGMCEIQGRLVRVRD